MTELKGTIKLEPLSSFEVTRLDDAIFPNTETAFAVFNFKDIQPYLVAPVERKSDIEGIFQTTTLGWERNLTHDNNQDTPSFFYPVILSSRNKWYFKEQKIEIFDRAVILDGAKRLLAISIYSFIIDFPALIIPGLNEKQELAFRRTILDNGTNIVRYAEKQKVGTSTPRLQIGDEWVNLSIKSDPFVIKTFRGYAPAILVRRDQNSITEHIFIGAKSLSDKLDYLHTKYGSLINLYVSIKRASNDQMAPYELKFVRVLETSE